MRFPATISILATLALTMVSPLVVCGSDKEDRSPEVVSAQIDISHEAVAVRTDEPPIIDGRIDEAVWEKATIIKNLRQVEPVENSEPSERTVVRILFDSDFLYVAIRCYDSEPDKIIATQMRREGQLFFDDRVLIVLDTFHDRRNAYFFEMNPVGGRTDALIENNNNFRTDWDGIWYGKSSIDDEGWVVEMAIPFKTINFDQNNDTWGLNIQRSIRRKNEDIRWSAPFQNKSFRSISDAGELSGLVGLEQGVGLDFVPYGKTSYLRDHNAGESDTETDIGFDLFYNITPSLKAAFTVNTDFAETEVDERQVNLTRFPLFFPEKRDFFLQDAGIFNFGGIRRDPLPFFSRRIGIGNSGEAVDILAGVKVTGRQGDLNIGLLNVQADEHSDIDDKNLAVGRLSYNVLAESEVGMIFTNGDPTSNGSNTVVGFDFNFRDSEYNGNQTATGNAWVLQSKTPGIDGGETAYGIKVGYPNDTIDWDLGFTHIDKEFNPALGFVPRRGIREYFGRFRYRWRPGTDIRRIDVGVFSRLITDLDNSLESSSIRFNIFEIETEYGDEIQLEYSLLKEDLDDSFEISDGVVLPVDTYDWDEWKISYEGSRARLLRFSAHALIGDFWSGDRWQLGGEVEWRASKNLFLSVEFEQNQIDLDEGDFITRIGRARVNIYFTPDISWQTFVQYDNVSDTMGLNSRFKWIVQPGSEVFFVLNQGYDVIDSRIHSAFTQVTSKVGWTFRF
ncbi:MAG: DUF5916 domain-containing protein [Planctomycetota bacterium]|nr:DUF5916 domain-containing protein [Planctomycetota bacterium]